MNLTLVLLIFFFLAAVLGASVFYYLTLQNLAAVKREVNKLRDQADDARASALLRNERALLPATFGLGSRHPDPPTRQPEQ